MFMPGESGHLDHIGSTTGDLKDEAACGLQLCMHLGNVNLKTYQMRLHSLTHYFIIKRQPILATHIK